MPLDELQKAVLAVLLSNRSPESVFAGGAVLHRHAFRLSDDQDIFHAEETDIIATALRDVRLLRDAGFEVDETKSYEGFMEAVVGTATSGFTKVQWVQAGSWYFFKPVPDPDYGYRLHMVDLAVNKVLAAAGRREVRDFVDIALIHRHIMPLWQAIWAAPGKDEKWTPESLAERIARNNTFRQEDMDEAVLSLTPLSARKIGTTVGDAIDEARDIFPSLPVETVGSLMVDTQGGVLTDYCHAGRDGVTQLQPQRGGTWPSGPAIDHSLIRKLIKRFGQDGARAADAAELGD